MKERPKECLRPIRTYEKGKRRIARTRDVVSRRLVFFSLSFAFVRGLRKPASAPSQRGKEEEKKWDDTASSNTRVGSGKEPKGGQHGSKSK